MAVSTGSTVMEGMMLSLSNSVRRLAAVGFFAFCAAAHAQVSYQFTTLAGSPGKFGAADGTGANARFGRSDRMGVAVDSVGNIFVGDGSTVRKITAAGVVTTLAGSADQTGSVDGIGADARFGWINGLALDAAGNVYATDTNNTVRKITPAGLVTTLAGFAGRPGDADGMGAAARFNLPGGVAVDVAGNVCVADLGNDTVRKITPAGLVTTIAGASGKKGSADGNGSAARFNLPNAIAADMMGNLYVSDGGNFTIRKITLQGDVTTLAGLVGHVGSVDGRGTEANFGAVGGVAVDALGSIFVTTRNDHTVRMIGSDGTVTTIAGQTGQAGSGNGIGGGARFNQPDGIAIDSAGNLYVAESGSQTVRKGVATAALSPPCFTVGPYRQSQFVGAGTSLTLTGVASSTAPVAYQWTKDSLPLPGATHGTLVLTALGAGDAGSYSVTAANAAGSQTMTVGTIAVYTPPVRSFASRHEKIGGSFLWGIAAGGGRLVAVGTGGMILTSMDGLAWDRAVSGTSEWLLAVARGAGKFVAVGDRGTILVSVDGTHWAAAQNSGTTRRLNNVIWGDGLFVAVGEQGTIVTSPDAQTWTPRASGMTGWLRGLAYNPAMSQPIGYAYWRVVLPRYTACGEGGALITSNDGLAWSGEWTGTNLRADLEAMVSTESYGPYLAIGADGATLSAYQFGGTTYPPVLLWQGGTTKVPARLRGLSTGANALFATGEGGAILAAPEPYGPWAVVPSGTTANLVAGTFVGNSLYVVGENETILQSTPLYTSRLVNISSRAFAGQDASTLISGFVVQGPKPKQMLLRAVGPGLSSNFAMSGVATAPQLTLFNASGQPIARNTGWTSAANASDLATAGARVGAFPLKESDADSALLLTLDPGLYTAQVAAPTGTEGVCLIEAYDADIIANDGAKAVNISTRAEVGPGQNVLIAGFVIAGDSARRVLIRGAGPALHTQFGMSGVLAAPQLTLCNQAGNVLRRAGAWGAETNADEIRDAAVRAGAFAFPDGSQDSAMVTTLLPGIYTVQVSGAGDGTGVALVEVYDLP